MIYVVLVVLWTMFVMSLICADRYAKTDPSCVDTGGFVVISLTLFMFAGVLTVMAIGGII